MLTEWTARSSEPRTKIEAAAFASIDTPRRTRHRRSVARHLFVCTNTRASGKPACGRGGGAELVAAVQRLLVERRAPGDILVTPCGCLGPCFDGPNAVVYPEPPDGVWYGGLTADDAPGLVEHLMAGVPLAARVTGRPGSLEPADQPADEPTGAPGHAGSAALPGARGQ